VDAWLDLHERGGGAVKRALIISAVLLCAWVAGATGYYRQLMLLPRAAAVAVESDPTLLLEWHCETNNVLMGTPIGYSVGSNVLTKVFSPVFSSAVKYDGSYSLYSASSGARYDLFWSTNTSPVMAISSGTIDFWFYQTGLGYGTAIELYTGDANNKIYIQLAGSNGKISLTHVAGGTTRNAFTTAGAVTSNEWNHVKARWSSAGVGGKYIKVTVDRTTGESAQDTSTGGSALGSWSTTNNGAVRFGDSQYNGMLVYIDNVKIYNTWK